MIHPHATIPCSASASRQHTFIYTTLYQYTGTITPPGRKRHKSTTVKHSEIPENDVNTWKWPSACLPPLLRAPESVDDSRRGSKWITASSSLDNYTPSHPRQNPENTPGIQWEWFTVCCEETRQKALPVSCSLDTSCSPPFRALLEASRSYSWTIVAYFTASKPTLALPVSARRVLRAGRHGR